MDICVADSIHAYRAHCKTKRELNEVISLNQRNPIYKLTPDISDTTNKYIFAIILRKKQIMYMAFMTVKPIKFADLPIYIASYT